MLNSLVTTVATPPKNPGAHGTLENARELGRRLDDEDLRLGIHPGVVGVRTGGRSRLRRADRNPARKCADTARSPRAARIAAGSRRCWRPRGCPLPPRASPATDVPRADCPWWEPAPCAARVGERGPEVCDRAKYLHRLERVRGVVGKAAALHVLDVAAHGGLDAAGAVEEIAHEARAAQNLRDRACRGARAPGPSSRRRRRFRSSVLTACR